MALGPLSPGNCSHWQRRSGDQRLIRTALPPRTSATPGNACGGEALCRRIAVDGKIRRMVRSVAATRSELPARRLAADRGRASAHLTGDSTLFHTLAVQMCEDDPPTETTRARVHRGGLRSSELRSIHSLQDPAGRPSSVSPCCISGVNLPTTRRPIAHPVRASKAMRKTNCLVKHSNIVQFVLSRLAERHDQQFSSHT